uniref:Ring finger protein n=1 Tax=Rhizophora mucronata TaxID=61149 RepID=A0A2P2IRF0_RHIMU
MCLYNQRGKHDYTREAISMCPPQKTHKDKQHNQMALSDPQYLCRETLAVHL